MKKCILVSILLSILGDPIAWGQAASVPVRFAIVVGQNNSEDAGLPNLLYADDDAIATHYLFQQAGIKSTLLVSLDENSQRLHPKLIPAGPPTKDRVLSAFTTIKHKMSELKAMGRKVEFLFAYSGHGDVEHGEGYIVLEDGRLTRSDLYDKILAESPADRNHVIVDACKSYFLVFEKGPGGERQKYTQHFVDKDGGRRLGNTGFLLSTSSGQNSHEWERFQSGIFSHELHSALRGGADVDANRKISYEEIGAFLDTANQRIANPRYRPDFLVLPPGNYSSNLLDWSGHEDVLILDDTSWGHVYLENSKGDRLLDVHPADRECFYIQLPPERPLFLRQDKNTRELVVAHAGSTRMSELPPRMAPIRSKGALHLAFEELFAEPFGQSKVTVYKESLVLPTAQALTLETQAPYSPFEMARSTMFWTILGATALGGAANIWAYSRYTAGESSSQVERAKINQQIEKLNTTAIVFYALAGAAAATWLSMTLWPEEEVNKSQKTNLALTPLLTPTFYGLGLSLQTND
jgi:hypothetical protein